MAFAVATVLPSLAGRFYVPGDGVDLYGTLWFFWWIRDCVEHLRDPSTTQLFFYPFGKDILAHTGDNFVDAFLSVPLQWIFGNPGYYKAWVVAVIVGDALAFRALVAPLVKSPWARLAATLLFLANPYLVAELQTGRPTQAFLWFLVPAFLWLLRAETVAGGLLLGVLVAGIGWSYWFYGFFFAFAAVWLVAHEAWRRRRAGEPLGPWIRALAVGAVTSLVLVAPAAVAMARRKATNALPGVSSHAAGLFALPSDGPGVSHPHGYTLLETDGIVYLHDPVWALLLAGLVAVAVVPRRLGVDAAVARRWLGVAVVGLAVATGTDLTVGGSTIPMYPYLALYNGLPFFDRLWFPYRALVLVFLAVSVGAALLLDRAVARWGRSVAMGAASVLLVGTLVRQHTDEMWPLVVRDVTPPKAYDWMAGRGGAIVDLPPRIAQNFIVYQTWHHLPLLGGMGENVPVFWPKGYKESLRNPFVKALTTASRSPNDDAPFKPSDRDAFVRRGFQWVVLHRELVDSEFNRHAILLTPEQAKDAPFVIQDALTRILGEPVAIEGPMVVWSLDPSGHDPAPGDLRPDPRTARDRTWARPEPLPYEARLYELGRIK